MGRGKDTDGNREAVLNIRPGMIDSHFHSRIMGKKDLDTRKLLEKAVTAGLVGGLDIGTEAGDTAGRATMIDGFPQFGLAAGLYPSEAEHERLQDRLDLLLRDLQQFPVVAIGEIGIDLHWNYTTPKRQRDLMIQQIEVANRYGLPIIVHNRDADEEIAEVLKEHPPAAGGIMHCFSSGPEAAKTFLDAGMHISFAGNITYKKSDELRAAARAVPIDRLLTETDSPYLSPQAVRGKPNHPGHVGYVYETIASLRSIDPEKLVEAVRENFYRLFPLSPLYPSDQPRAN